MKAALCFIAFLAFWFAACKKSNMPDSSDSGSESTSPIMVAARLTNNNPGDSLCMLHKMHFGFHREAVSESDLPSTVNDYLTNNYSGYTFHRAFAVKNAGGNVAAFVVVVYYNNKPVGLVFNSSGDFLLVLEQREKGDLDGDGHGGRFHDRDGKHRDTIALTALPSSVLNYMSANYPTDTLLKAFMNCDSNIIILSQNGAIYATAFSANGAFRARVPAISHSGRAIDIAQTALPAVVQNYFSNTYPNAIFEKAFQLMIGNIKTGYVVILDANGTDYALEFDASGAFLRSKVLH
jgi:hypothetical protein